jgi:iron complex outermembrane receptor protein
VKSNQTLSCAIVAILAAHSGTAAAAAAAAAAGAAGSVAGSTGEIAEVVVTATRRSENLQDVPIAITALTGETLSQLNVQTFDDYFKYLPSMTTASKGPGQNEVYMRGLSTTQSGSQVDGGLGSFPNVAVYLDDQSVQLPGRNLDIYIADIERIEVLEGPQGTLYGAGAQAGAVRYITNKPKLNVTEGDFSAGRSITAHGDPSNAVQAVLNLPLIADRLAVRGVIYNESRGGYIHNIPGTFTRRGANDPSGPPDGGIKYYFNGVVPPNSIAISNANLATNAYNPTVYSGIRVSALYQFNEDWNLSLQQSYQSLEADGVFSYAPSLGDLNVQQYNPSTNKDTFEDTAWTLNGRLGALKAVYTGGYLVRHDDQVTDYTAYQRGLVGAYYTCIGGVHPAYAGTPYYNFPSKVPGVPDKPQCFSPSSEWHAITRNTHQSHEFRVSTPDEWRMRAIGGLFYEDFKIQASENFLYGSPDAGFPQIGPLAGTTTFDPSVRPPGDTFFNDITRGYKQKAVFGELAYDLVPNALTATIGTRFYRMDNFEKGSKNSAYGCRYVISTPSNPCVGLSTSLDVTKLPNGDVVPLRSLISGHKNKVNLSWKPATGMLLYATYSEGFRPGGFNRGQGVGIPSTSPCYQKCTIPLGYDTDGLKNYELGWKTTWLDLRLQFNGAIYEEKWSNVQLSLFDPLLYGNLNFTANGPDYRVRGIEGEVIFRATDQLTLTSSFAWNRSEQTNLPALVDANGNAQALFPTAGLGSPLAQSPPFQGNIRVRYDFTLADYRAHWQVAALHAAHSYASVSTAGAFEPPNQNQLPYSTYDASFGIAGGAWDMELYGQNLTDERPQLYVNGFDYVHLITPGRPRVLGLRLSYHFAGKNGS